jgi:hypothetical protein
MSLSYGLDDRGSIPGRGRDFLFSTASELALGPIQIPFEWASGSLPRE